MSEREVVERTVQPETADSLVSKFRLLGLNTGATVIVHSSLSALGWVVGGEHAVVKALIEAVGRNGTIVMPTQSSQLSDPSNWEDPPIPEAWWQTYRDHVPGYDVHLTPVRGMGRVVECFLRHPDSRRSIHPRVSFAALGLHADRVIENHELAFGLGESSPLAQLYDLNARFCYSEWGTQTTPRCIWRSIEARSLTVCEHNMELPS